MKKGVKRTLVIVLLGTLLLSLAGCGKSGKSETEQKEFVYVPEYVEMNFECDYFNQMVSDGENLYLDGVDWDEETNSQTNYLYKYNLLEKSHEVLTDAIPEDCNIYQMAINSEGNLLTVMNQYSYEEDENGEITDYKRTLELWEISTADGQILNQQDITGVFGNPDEAYTQYFCVDQQDNMYLAGGENIIYVLDKDYNKVADINVDNWINSMVASKEGDIYVTVYGAEGTELRKLELASKNLGAAISGVSQYGDQQFYPGVSASFLYNASNEVGTLDVADGTLQPLFQWLDVDINSNNVIYVGECTDGRIFAFTRTYTETADGGGNEAELVFFTKTKASEVEQKETITYGTMYLGYDVRESIINFNKSNDEYHISVKEYGQGDYAAGLTQMNADLAGANCPDIIDLNNISFSQYASKGVLEDLYPYMEKSGMNREDYLENILGAYEVDGKLYGLLSQFYINTTVAKASKVGDRNGWTLTEMLDFVESEKAGNIFQYESRDTIFYYCIYNNIDQFIDWETGQCSFDGEEFVRTLEFAATFPAEANYEDESEGISSLVRSDKVLLMQTSVSSVQEYQMMNGLFGEKTTYVGFPNSEGKGNMIQATGGSVGMASKSKHKDAVWEFMKTLISEETQNKMVDQNGAWGFPILKSALEAKFEKDMTPEYYTDENGEEVEQPKTSWGYDDFHMEIMAATREEVDAVREIIASAEMLSGTINEELTNIITEESQPFFAGQKSAADAAGVIQNRIQIYVNENR